VKAGEQFHLLFYFMSIKPFILFKKIYNIFFHSRSTEILSVPEFAYCAAQNFYCTFNGCTKSFLKKFSHINWHAVSRLYIMNDIIS